MKYSTLFLIIIILVSCKPETIKPEKTGDDLTVFKFYSGAKHQLVRVNRTEGSIISTSDTVFMPGIWYTNGLAKSNENHMFYVLNSSVTYEATGISIISMENGQELDFLPIIPEENFTYIGLAYHEDENVFYALQIGVEKHLVKINPDNGEAIRITKVPIEYEGVFGTNCFEFIEDQGIYMFIQFKNGSLQLISFDILTGEMLNTIPMTHNIKGIKQNSDSTLLCLLTKDDNYLTNSLGLMDFSIGDITILKENIFYGEMRGVDYNADLNEYAILIYDGDIRIIGCDLTNNNYTQIANLDNNGRYYYLNYY